MRRFLPALCLLAVVGTAHALPDLERGKRALEAGDYETAQADLKPLAERGYLEAQIHLARMYDRIDTPVALEQAARWYRQVLRRDPGAAVSLARVLLRSGDPAVAPEADQLLREAHSRDRGIAPALRLRLYRDHPQLAKPGEAEGLAAQLAISARNEDVGEAISWYRAQESAPELFYRAGELCEQARSWLPECYVDLVRLYRARDDAARLDETLEEAQARHESGWLSTELVERMARSLISENYAGPPMQQAAYRMFDLVVARPGEAPAEAITEARVRMARMLMDQPEVGEDDPEELLLEAAANGSPEAKYYLGRLQLEGNRPRDPAQAVRLLEAAAPTVPGAHFQLGRIYERGYLGSADPVRAFQHYIAAARAGYHGADLALAKMYSANRGVRVDAVNAYAFARLALHHQVTGSEELMATLQQTLTREQIALGQQKAEAEFHARQARLDAPAQTPADAPATDMASFLENRR